MKTFLIFAGVALVCLLLIIRFFFSQFSSHQKEREWFVRNIRYEFSATIDSVRMFNQVTGRLHARITAGDPRTYREDSLENSFKKHAELEFISKHRGDSISFFLHNANQIKKGDSVRVSSSGDAITIFREGKQVAVAKMSDSLNGWSKPPIGN
jgi:hypothetical protein